MSHGLREVNMISPESLQRSEDLSKELRLLRLPEVRKATGLSRSMIYSLESKKRFPTRVKISARAVGWMEDEVQRWIAERRNTRASERRIEQR
jgi:prophage regulatory protein